ncbi:MAG TPA: SLC13 family permease [Steroidobacteraceae bacterium]|nr:SLC13 family permease [Steroidobacteraceae bacterium]
MPNPHAVAVLVVTVVVFYLYTRRWMRMELVSLLLLASLLSIFYLFPYVSPAHRITEAEVLQSFGHPALVAICSLMVMGRGLTTTGALEPIVRLIGRVWELNTAAGLLLTLGLAALASGFINDTPVLVLMLPLLLSLAERTGYPASRTLMPVNFAILIGGMLTSIGTSTNLLVLSIAADFGMKPMGVFDFTATTGIALLVALPYLWLVAPRLLGTQSSEPKEHAREFDARIVAEAHNGKLVGRDKSALRRVLGRNVPLVELIRGGERLPADTFGTVEAGDVLVLRDTPAGLRDVAAAFGAELFDLTNRGPFIASAADDDDVSLGEVVIGTASTLVGSTLSQARFAERFHVVVVGLKRGTEQILRDGLPIGDVPLTAGDVLLVQGRDRRLRALKAEPHLLVLDSNLQLPRSPLAWRALLIMFLVVAAAATRIMPIHVAAFLGVIAMLLAGCVNFDGLGRALSPAVVLLVASSIALGHSIVTTGAAAWIAEGVTALVEPASPAVQIAAFMAFSALLTNFVSNSAAAAVGTPIAVATATQLGAPLEPFVLAIMFGANLSFATPMAYQTNLLVMNAAGYTFRDFIRVGLPLVVIMLVTLSLLLVRRYGF